MVLIAVLGRVFTLINRPKRMPLLLRNFIETFRCERGVKSAIHTQNMGYEHE